MRAEQCKTDKTCKDVYARTCNRLLSLNESKQQVHRVGVGTADTYECVCVCIHIMLIFYVTKYEVI